MSATCGTHRSTHRRAQLWSDLRRVTRIASVAILVLAPLPGWDLLDGAGGGTTAGLIVFFALFVLGPMIGLISYTGLITSKVLEGVGPNSPRVFIGLWLVWALAAVVSIGSLSLYNWLIIVRWLP